MKNVTSSLVCLMTDIAVIPTLMLRVDALRGRVARLRHGLRPLVVVVGIVVGGSLTAAPAAEKPVSFTDDIRPLFNKNCVSCHGGVKKAG